MLCGSMFNLRVYRHRYFECSPALWWVPFSCNHWAARGRGPTDSKRVNGKRVTASLKNSDVLSVTGHGYITPDGRAAMGIDWMTRDELSQAIPPRYTEYLGKEMIKLWK